MSFEKTNYRDELNAADEIVKMSKSSDNYAMERNNFDERAQAFKENRSNALTSNFSTDYNPKNTNYTSISTRQLSKTHHSNINYGNQKFSNVNEKFSKRYSRKSLEGTNVGVADFREKYLSDQSSREINDDQQNANDINAEIQETIDAIDSNNHQIYPKSHEDEENNLLSELSEINLQQHEKSEKIENSMPTNNDNYSSEGLSYNDKTRSELIFLYLTHNDLKRKISDLEVREHRAATKGLWEDALRLRDMKNRLELMREREIYQRDDLQIDPQTRQFVVDNIEKRKQLLEKRKKLCTDSWMYSEEAKLTWDKWLEEDKKSIIIDGNDQRENLLKQLEEEWLGLAESDKQRITHTYNNVMSGSSLQNELKLIASNIFH
ncbi:hypothetical protein PV328_000326 [Microctonus aethiopoides]|uniref:Uncharacterized protein n=1 Tax=Microctonus aethiopoides TaxID=144406 RepID=A0AA39FUN7_9HYME|nr:hypothetical protein PV328_000326 [Microctonus aethiopoides]